MNFKFISLCNPHIPYFYPLTSLCHPREGGDPEFSGLTLNSCIRGNDNVYRLFFLIILLPLFLFSCSDNNKKYDKEKAVSAFAVIDTIKIDPQLEGVKIILPKQQKNYIWNGSNNDQNQRVENFSKEFLTKKKFWSNSSEIVLKNTAQIWSSFSFISDDDFVFSPVIKDDKAFLLSASGVLSLHDLSSKKKIWKSRIFERKFLKNYQSPKISYNDGKIFAVAGVNKIVAASAVDGKVLWSKDISSIPISKPISDGKLVFVTTNDNKVYALNALNGELQWVVSAIIRNTAIIGAADPIFYQDTVIAGFSSGEIYAVSKKTGEVLWSQDLNLSKANSSDFYLNDIDATPLSKDGVVYAIGNGGFMMAIDANKGNYLWKREIAGITDFWLAGDFLYVINNDNRLIAVHKKTGGVKWISQLPNLEKDSKPQTKIIYDGLVMVGDKLLISNIEGKLLIASPFDGKVEKTYDVGERTYHSPIIVGGKIYLHRLGRYVVDLLEVN